MATPVVDYAATLLTPAAAAIKDVVRYHSKTVCLGERVHPDATIGVKIAPRYYLCIRRLDFSSVNRPQYSDSE
jgi:hypothetical protein